MKCALGRSLGEIKPQIKQPLEINQTEKKRRVSDVAISGTARLHTLWKGIWWKCPVLKTDHPQKKEEMQSQKDKTKAESVCKEYSCFYCGNSYSHKNARLQKEKAPVFKRKRIILLM